MASALSGADCLKASRRSRRSSGDMSFLIAAAKLTCGSLGKFCSASWRKFSSLVPRNAASRLAALRRLCLRYASACSAVSCGESSPSIIRAIRLVEGGFGLGELAEAGAAQEGAADGAAFSFWSAIASLTKLERRLFSALSCSACCRKDCVSWRSLSNVRYPTATRAINPAIARMSMRARLATPPDFSRFLLVPIGFIHG